MFRSVRRLFSSTSAVNSGIKYTKSHEWIKFDPNTKLARVGISNYAQQQIGQIIHIETPIPGKQLQAGDSAAVIESVKIAADVYTPVAGKVKATNKNLQYDPSLVNTEPLTSWIFEIEYKQEPQGLLQESEYLKIVGF